LQQQKSQIEEAIAKAQEDQISRCALENQVSLAQLEEKLQPIVTNCTKESIQNGKYSASLTPPSKSELSLEDVGVIAASP
jgi:hypothetical protein